MDIRHIAAALVLLAAPLGPGFAAAQTCGNGTVEPPEACDPPGSLGCPGGSPGGAFQACQSDCSCPGAGSALGAFQCYGARVDFDAVSDVELVDRVGSWTVAVDRLTDVCAPAAMSEDDTDASDDAVHLARYVIRTGDPSQTVRGERVVNALGTFTLDVFEPVSLLVPTAKSLDGPASPLGAFVDHFTCHRVKRTSGTPRFAGDEVTIETQFETAVIDLKKPRSLCLPTDKNGEAPGAEDHPDELLCFKVKGRKGIGRPAVFLNNQFGAQSGKMRGHRHELCVPSNSGSVTTTTTSSTTTSSSSTTVPSTSSTTVPLPTTTSTTASPVTSTTTTTSLSGTTTTTTTLYGSPSRAFLLPVGDLLS